MKENNKNNDINSNEIENGVIVDDEVFLIKFIL
jgi:hypothetical protein